MPDDPEKDEATKRGDEILRRMLKTPPKPRKAEDKPKDKDKPDDA
jgi:hypothetical protein